MREFIVAVMVLHASSVLAGDTLNTETRSVSVKVTEDGFEPREIKVKKGQPMTLVFTRVTEATCITAIDIPDGNVRDLDLPLNKAVRVRITPKRSGVENFHCSAMAMGDGRLIVAD